MEAKRFEFQGHPQIHNELETSKLHNLSKKKTMSQVWWSRYTNNSSKDKGKKLSYMLNVLSYKLNNVMLS